MRLDPRTAAVLLVATLLAPPALSRPRGMPRRPGTAQTVIGPTSSPQCIDAIGDTAPCQFRYFGGPVVSNVKVYAVLWGKGVDAETQASIGDFFSSLTNDDWMDWLDEYDTELLVDAGSLAGHPGTGQVIGRGTFAGVRQITPSFTGQEIFDVGIGQELRRQIAAGNLPPPDANTVYALFFPPGISIDMTGGGRSCAGFCAFHAAARADGGTLFEYLVVPDFRAPDSVNGGGCDTGCGSLDPFSNLCAATSHELAEAMTNPDVELLPTVDAPLGWYDPVNFEIGDPCYHSVTRIAAPDGGTFGAQLLYSQESRLCQAGRQLDSGEPEFKIWLPSNRATMITGGVLDVAVATATVNGAAQPLSLTVPRLPAGVSASLPANVTSGQGFTLHLTADPDAGVATDAVVPVVARGDTAHSASLLLQVVGDFALEVSPATVAVGLGTSTPVSVRVVALGTATPVALTVAGLPAGVTATFAKSTVLSGEQTTLTLAVSPSASAEASLTLTGTAADLSRSASLALSITPQPSPTAAGCTSASGPAFPALAVLCWILGNPRRRRS